MADMDYKIKKNSSTSMVGVNKIKEAFRATVEIDENIPDGETWFVDPDGNLLCKVDSKGNIKE